MCQLVLLTKFDFDDDDDDDDEKEEEEVLEMMGHVVPGHQTDNRERLTCVWRTE